MEPATQRIILKIVGFLVADHSRLTMSTTNVITDKFEGTSVDEETDAISKSFSLEQHNKSYSIGICRRKLAKLHYMQAISMHYKS